MENISMMKATVCGMGNRETILYLSADVFNVMINMKNSNLPQHFARRRNSNGV